jgi:BASS family bile acid:Na+ symporter
MVFGFRDGGLMFSESKLLLALLLINVLGYLSGYLAGRLVGMNDSMRRALTLEVGMQNCGLGTTLVLRLFPGDEYVAATIPTAAYTFGCVFTATILALFWSRIPVKDGSDTEAAATAPQTAPAGS